MSLAAGFPDFSSGPVLDLVNNPDASFALSPYCSNGESPARPARCPSMVEGDGKTRWRKSAVAEFGSLFS